jgi:hypothetical protein
MKAIHKLKTLIDILSGRELNRVREYLEMTVQARDAIANNLKDIKALVELNNKKR